MSILCSCVRSPRLTRRNALHQILHHPIIREQSTCMIGCNSAGCGSRLRLLPLEFNDSFVLLSGIRLA